jgi:hypothetical protein
MASRPYPKAEGGPHHCLERPCASRPARHMLRANLPRARPVMNISRHAEPRALGRRGQASTYVLTTLTATPRTDNSAHARDAGRRPSTAVDTICKRTDPRKNSRQSDQPAVPIERIRRTAAPLMQQHVYPPGGSDAQAIAVRGIARAQALATSRLDRSRPPVAILDSSRQCEFGPVPARIAPGSVTELRHPHALPAALSQASHGGRTAATLWSALRAEGTGR